jgi:trans-aconitate methyltransferase
VAELIAHFDELHAAEADPWQVTSRWYERRKRALTVAALPLERYVSAFEPGCSIGALTELLAQRCDRLLAIDAAASAVERCRTRLAGTLNVTVEQGRLPEDWPAGPFDLVVLSEVGYYFEVEGVRYLAERTLGSLTTGGEVVAAHWRGCSEDHLLHADAVHAELRREFGPPVAQYEQAEFRLDVWSPA